MSNEKEKKAIMPQAKDLEPACCIGVLTGHPVFMPNPGSLIVANVGQSIKPNPPRIRLNTDYIKGIYVDEIEKIVVVKFADNSIEKVKCSKEDDFDPTVGVSLALSRHLFGSHSRFYKHVVKRKTQYVKRAEANSYGSYVKWCHENKKRFVSETTFKKNKAKYLNRMKGE